MKKILRIAGLALVLVLIVIMILCMMLFWKQQKKPESEITVPASVQISPTEEKIYETTGEKIFLENSPEGWLPVFADVPACAYQADQFISRNNRMYYLENQKIISKFGIDVSYHQEEIDWQKVKASGVEFAFIRAGRRGYTEGVLTEDEYFRQNIQGARDAGIDIGVYFYSQAITPEEALEEAEMTLALLDGMELQYPVVYDWEVIPDAAARTDGMTAGTLTECCVAFCEKIREAGYIPMIYQNKRTSLLKLQLPELTAYDFWLAEYNPQATYYYDYQIWQYASDGRVPGIKGNVDLNICFRNYAEPAGNAENQG